MYFGCRIEWIRTKFRIFVIRQVCGSAARNVLNSCANCDKLDETQQNQPCRIMKRILIVGAGGQIGSELTVYLRKVYGRDNVGATDVRESEQLRDDGPFEILNALDAIAYASVVGRYKIDTIFNPVALLSADGVKHPPRAGRIHRGALMH